MTTATLRRGERLPAVALETAEGTRAPLRGLRGPVVAYVAHSADCDACLDYVRTLAAALDRIGEWGATVRVVTTSASHALRKAAGHVTVLLDPAGLVVNRKASSPARLIVADEWGEIYFAAEADADHAGLPAPDEIVEWARFVAVQCPECEQPEGEWRKI